MSLITISKNVVLTKSIQQTLSLLEPYFETAKQKVTVTSGYRDPQKQLAIIKKYAEKFGVWKKYPEVLKIESVNEKDQEGNYTWQKAWSKLLNEGVIINPPLPAKCLFDYYKNGVNKKGNIIPASPHLKGTDFDLSGGEDINKIIAIVHKAYYEGKSNIKYYVIEKKNNCVHIGGIA